MLNNLILFIISFVAPFIFFRIVLFIISPTLEGFEHYMREGRKFHHFHFGTVIMFVGVLSFIVLGPHPLSSIISGIGWGMVMDEFVASMYLPEPEPEMRIIYSASWKSTALILALAAGVAVGVYFVIN